MILSNYAIKFRNAVFVFVLLLVLAGINVYRSLPREGSPDITIPYVFISAYYEGTAPEEMEKLIAIPLEKELNNVEGVKEVESYSADSICSISIEFEAGEDIDEAKQRVKDKVDVARPDLPDDLDEPMVDALNFSTDTPILRFALSGKTDPARLKKLAEDLQEDVELISGVREAEILGTREREIRVELDLPRLIAYDLPISFVMQRIAEENVTISAGNIEMEGSKFQVRVPGEFNHAFELENIMVTERHGAPVYLTDIAAITDTYKDLDSISRLNGESSVSISVKKRSGENAVNIIDEIKEALDLFTIPPGISLTIVMDESEYISSTIEELENNIFSGFLLVIVVLLLFVGGRNSLFVAMAIPLSMLLAFILLPLIGFTLNMMVQYSLVLAVGMLVDNAIVIVENIYRHRTEGLSRIEAARTGASEVAWPVITSTLTTVGAFSPLIFWPGIMGQFMGYLPRTLIIVLSASLFVAIIINPAICSALITKGSVRRRKRDTSEHHPFVRGYESTLRTALQNRVPIMLIGFSFLVLTILIYGRFGKGVELFPDTEPRNCIVDIRFPQGTRIEKTDRVLASFEEIIADYRDVEFYQTTVGGSGGDAMAGGAAGSHLGNIYVEFLDVHDRERKSSELVDEIRTRIGQVAGADLKVEKQREGPPVEAPISIELAGEDFDVLSEQSGAILRTIKSVSGLVDLQDDFEEALPEIQFQVNRKKAALLGLDTATVGNFLRTAIYGLESSKFRVDEDEYDITVRLPEEQRDSARLFDQIYIPTATGNPVPLASAGTIKYTGGRGAITRKNQKRVVTITGNNQNRGVDKILQDVQGRISELALPAGYTITYAGDNEEMQEALSFLSKAFAIALGVIYIILVIQFNSPILPFIILFSVVLSLIGVMWGLLICDMRFGVIMTGLGVISLAGIVVNNAIVLVDCILQRQREGMTVTEAIVSAGHTRLRPVLLTAVTTILGLIPMAIGYSLEIHQFPPRLITGAESSQWWGPMAVAVIFGLSVATILTLVMVPVMYSLSFSLGKFFRERWAPKEEL